MKARTPSYHAAASRFRRAGRPPILAPWRAGRRLPTEPLRVVATTGMIADIVRDAGRRARRGDGADGRGRRPAPLPRHALRRGPDAARPTSIFYNGLLLEGKMTDALVRVARSGKPVFAVTELIDESYLLAPPAFAGHFDPHVWMDPAPGRRRSRWSATIWCSSIPPAAPAYDANAAALPGPAAGARRLCRRGAGERAGRAPRPGHRPRRLRLFRPALRLRGAGHPGPQHRIRGRPQADRGAGRASWSSAGSRPCSSRARSPSRACGRWSPVRAARGHEVTIGGTLFSDAMGRPGTYEGTYVGMIDHNVTLIARALGGSTPAARVERPAGPGGLTAMIAAHQPPAASARRLAASLRRAQPRQPAFHPRAHGRLPPQAGALGRRVRGARPQPDRHRRPERRRQVDADQGVPRPRAQGLGLGRGVRPAGGGASAG